MPSKKKKVSKKKASREKASKETTDEEYEREILAESDVFIVEKILNDKTAKGVKYVSIPQEKGEGDGYYFMLYELVLTPRTLSSFTL